MTVNSEPNRIELLVKLLRRWAAARAAHENPLFFMYQSIGSLAVVPHLIPACDSMFCLTEAQLGRALVPGKCCSRSLSHDERALMLILRHISGAGTIKTGRAIPHGLPGALIWATFAVRQALQETLEDSGTSAMPASKVPDQCPFNAGAQAWTA